MGQARELMDRVTHAVLAGDLDTLREIYAPDVVVSTPDVGTLYGVAAILEWNRAFIDAFSDRDYRSERALETQERALDQGGSSAPTHGHCSLPTGRGVPPTGKQVRVRSVDIATVANRKIVWHDLCFDQLDMLTQLGLMEAVAPPTT
jgi:ketosteroid isomerase-like protein